MKLFDHQQKALEETKDLNRVAYYHDMGLGKTFTGAEKMKELGARVNLLICQKSKIGDWIDHFKNHYVIYPYDLTNKKDFNDFMFWVDRAEGSTVIGIINYELSFRRSKLLELRNFTLMLDESSLIQNESAKRSKFALKLGDNAANVILLSGTPTSGKYEKLYSQMHLLGWNISKRMYWNQYVKVEYLDNLGRSIPIVTGYKNVDRLKRKMRKYGCNFLKTEEVFDLPDQVFETIKVDSTKEYKQFRENRIIEINGNELVGDTTLTKMLYERELCGMYNNNKLQVLKDLFESTDESFVVFYNFNEELEQIKKVAESCNREYGIINGNDKSGLKMVNYSLNHNYRYIPIIICQYKAGAMGLNLQGFTRRIIYFTLPLSSELFEQSKKRIHRIGQNKTCFYYLLLCKKSVEEKIYKTLKQRKDYTEKLFERGE